METSAEYTPQNNPFIVAEMKTSVWDGGKKNPHKTVRLRVSAVPFDLREATFQAPRGKKY